MFSWSGCPFCKKAKGLLSEVGHPVVCFWCTAGMAHIAASCMCPRWVTPLCLLYGRHGTHICMLCVYDVNGQKMYTVQSRRCMLNGAGAPWASVRLGHPVVYGVWPQCRVRERMVCAWGTGKGSGECWRLRGWGPGISRKRACRGGGETLRAAGGYLTFQATVLQSWSYLSSPCLAPRPSLQSLRHISWAFAST